MGKGLETRERILAIAEMSVLAKGFGATSIDEVIAEAGITKSGFFYHFKDKNELARAMLLRYVEADNRVFDDVFGRGRQLSDDPLQAFLIGLKLLAEVMADLPHGHPGCLIASVCYQERMFDREVRAIAVNSVQGWNVRFRATLDEIAAQHPPREAVDLDTVADVLHRRRRHHHVQADGRPAPARAPGAGIPQLRQDAVFAQSGRACRAGLGSGHARRFLTRRPPSALGSA